VHDSGISIWFFVGISLLVNGALILAAGVWELFNPPANPVVLFSYHANVWWGAALLLLGIVYSLRFRPRGSDF
jgi:FtsH-binding integral membrane protein